MINSQSDGFVKSCDWFAIDWQEYLLYYQVDYAVKEVPWESPFTWSRRTMFLMLYSYRMKYEGISTLLKGPKYYLSSFFQS